MKEEIFHKHEKETFDEENAYKTAKVVSPQAFTSLYIEDSSGIIQNKTSWQKY